MSTSVILFLVAAVFGVLLYALGVWAQPAGRPLARRMARPRLLGMLAAILGLGVLFGLIDRSVAENTLYETSVPASVPGEHRFTAGVEHPGAEHTILVDLLADEQLTATAETRVRIVDGTGRVLVDAPRPIAWECPSKGRCRWAAHYEYVHPGPGALSMTIAVASPGIETLHVAVFDEEKTDGERMPGY